MSPLAPLANAAASLAETIVISLLSKIRYGRLTICTPSATHILPPPTTHDDTLPGRRIRKPMATIHVRNSNFFLRVLLSGDLGFAESYMFGEVDIDPEDLVQIFLIVIRNKDAVSSLEQSPLAKLLELPKRVISRVAYPLTQLVSFTATGISNVLADARANISAHYDLGNEMFEGFLSRDMTYSCAIFPALDADLDMSFSSLALHPNSNDGDEEVNTGASSPTMLGSDDGLQGKNDDDELHDAQVRKLKHILQKADVRPGQRVLEIGSGWGALSLMITQTIPGTVVDTLTLSTQQAEYVRARVEELSSINEEPTSLKERLRVHLMDYRSMPQEWKGAFDRVISVEMVEAVGKEYLETYFGSIDWALRTDNGVAVIQGITIPEARYEEYIKREDFIQKWIFPGGVLPTVTGLVNAITNGSKGRLVVDSISNIGPHYARTLREWRRRFEAGFGEGHIIEEALKKEHPEVMDGSDGKAAIEVFRRKWIYYFVYCEAGFTTRSIGDHIITFCREGNPEYGCKTFA